jgi:spore coat protein H
MGLRGRTAWAIEGGAAVVLAVALAGCGGGGQSSDGGGGGGSLSQRPAAAVPIFDGARVHEIALEMSAADWRSIIDDARGNEWRHATVTYDGVVVEDVGVRPAGEGSRFPGNPKMSIRIKFDAFEGQGMFDGYRDVNVKGTIDDTSMLRERLSLYFFGLLMPAPKAAHARLVVNGELHGLYTLREDWDETSVATHFSPPLGPLYRLRPPDNVTDPYVYKGADPALYVPLPWDPRIKEAARGDDVVPTFLQALADPAAFETIVDVDNLIAYIAASAITMTTDGLAGSSGIDDHFQYFDPSTGKFVVLPWDLDNTFGSQGETPEKLIYSRLGRNVMTTVVRDRSDLRARYKAKVADAMASIPIATLHAEADRIHAQIRDAAHEDPKKTFPNDTFEWSVGNVKDFAAARYANLQGQLAQ